MKMLISVSAFLVCLSAASGPAAVADTGRGGGVLFAEGTHEEDARRDDCLDLIRDFDRTKTDNAEAVRLRDAAAENCAGAADSDVYRGWDQIRQALRMIDAY